MYWYSVQVYLSTPTYIPRVTPTPPPLFWYLFICLFIYPLHFPLEKRRAVGGEILVHTYQARDGERLRRTYLRIVSFSTSHWHIPCYLSFSFFCFPWFCRAIFSDFHVVPSLWEWGAGKGRRGEIFHVSLFLIFVCFCWRLRGAGVRGKMKEKGSIWCATRGLEDV